MDQGTSSKISRQRARRWVMTINDQEDMHVEDSEALLHGVFRDRTIYGVFGREIAPTTGRKHLQGLMCFNRPVTFDHVKTLLEGTNAHIEPMRGTLEQCEEYGKKDGNYIIFNPDARPQQGKRSDLDDLRDMALLEDAPTTLQVLKEDRIRNLQQLRFYQAVRELSRAELAKKSESQAFVIWAYHQDGQLHLARNLRAILPVDKFDWRSGASKYHPHKETAKGLVWMLGTKWAWGIEEDSASHLSLATLSALLGNPSLPTETKGAHVHLDYDVVILTADEKEPWEHLKDVVCGQLALKAGSTIPSAQELYDLTKPQHAETPPLLSQALSEHSALLRPPSPSLSLMSQSTISTVMLQRTKTMTMEPSVTEIITISSDEEE